MDIGHFIQVFIGDFARCFKHDLRDKIVLVQTDKCATFLKAVSKQFNDFENTGSYIVAFRQTMTRLEQKELATKGTVHLIRVLTSKQFAEKCFVECRKEGIRCFQHVCVTHSVGAFKTWASRKKGKLHILA